MFLFEIAAAFVNAQGAALKGNANVKVKKVEIQNTKVALVAPLATLLVVLHFDSNSRQVVDTSVDAVEGLHPSVIEEFGFLRVHVGSQVGDCCDGLFLFELEDVLLAAVLLLLNDNAFLGAVDLNALERKDRESDKEGENVHDVHGELVDWCVWCGAFFL